MAKKKQLTVSDLLGQEVETGVRVVYLRSTREGYIPIQSIVKQVKIRARTENDTHIYGSPPIVQVTLDCGKIWGTRKIRDNQKLIVVDKLGLSKWKLG